MSARTSSYLTAARVFSAYKMSCGESIDSARASGLDPAVTGLRPPLIWPCVGCGWSMREHGSRMHSNTLLSDSIDSVMCGSEGGV